LRASTAVRVSRSKYSSTRSTPSERAERYTWREASRNAKEGILAAEDALRQHADLFGDVFDGGAGGVDFEDFVEESLLIPGGQHFIRQAAGHVALAQRLGQQLRAQRQPADQLVFGEVGCGPLDAEPAQ
jgi:hypothetical protein